MASSKDDIVICHVCGFKNSAKAARCVSCGARLEEIAGAAAERTGKRSQGQGGFDIRWALLSLVVYLGLQALVLVALPRAIDAYDPQGFSALLVSLGVWFLGGVVVGFLSPGKTFVEPALGALIALVPTVYWMMLMSPSAPEELGGGFQLSLLEYVMGGLIGATLSLFGAFVGEKIQDGTTGRARRA